ncbi:MAG: zinc-binding dehydrogenase [Acidimicrobiia bacterium]|nr:zinc-binding dehydrogenase [Acidimicrobiia bacterium]MDH3399137.1 zinc-binding dehydrogenase [Acidimicrobiia bacterium]
MKHHRVIVSKRGGPEVLHVIEEDVPKPNAGQVRVRVEAAGVSAYDLMLRRSGGSIPGAPRVPYSPGEDVIGVVDELGEGVSDVEPGQRVAVFTRGGGYAEYLCVPAENLVPVPPGVDAAQAVCVVVNYLTAFLAMHETAHVHEGERILVHGAAGGVGSALLDLGRIAGLEMCGTASSRNHDFVSAHGAIPIDYHTEDFVKRIRDLIGEGVDVAFDPIGGARQILRSYRALSKNGRLVWFGMAAAKKKGARVIPYTLLMLGLLKLVPGQRQAPLMPALGDFIDKHPDWYPKTLADLLDLLAAKEIEPMVTERISLHEARRAHEILQRGGHTGKVVLVTS